METETQANRKKNTLEAMPEVVMKNIFHYCDSDGILSLRKSCRRFRYLVDTIHPDLHVKQAKLFLYPIQIEIGFIGENSMWRGATYNNVDGGCVVSCPKQSDKKKYFKKTTAEEIFIRDLEILLPMFKHQKIPIEQLEMVLGERGIPLLQRSMAPLLSDQLPVKYLILRTYDAREGVSAMLPLIFPEHLENLRICRTGPQRDVFDTSAMMEKWRRLRRLHIPVFRIDDPTRVMHIPDIKVAVVAVLPEQAVLMKETFRNSPEFVKCKVSCIHAIPQETKRAISFVENENNIWYFSTSTRGKVLRIACRYSKILEFEICDSVTLRGNDVVLD